MKFPPEESTEIRTALTRSVSATQGWQKTGIQYEAGDEVIIEWDRRSFWNGNFDNPYEKEPHGPAGPTKLPAAGGPTYPMPGVIEDSLVGKIGGATFFIGEGVRRKTETAGELFMTINDVGHYDNKGTITVSVIRHLSVFGLAPIPLLMELGRLLSDVSEVDVYDRHREPAQWAWPGDHDHVAFSCDKGGKGSERVALGSGPIDFRMVA